MASIVVRAYDPATDESWAAGLFDGVLGGRWQARRGVMIDALGVPGLVATDGSERLGILTYQRVGNECELVAFAVGPRRRGVGTALLGALRSLIAECDRIWLVTTNDNLDALRFYQRRGFRLCALRPGAVDDARQRIKPSISLIGSYGIPLRDELELETSPSVVSRES